MRTKQDTDFVSLLYAKQLLMYKWINMDTQDGRSRIKYFAIGNKIYDMKTTLILNHEYKKLPSAKNILGDFRIQRAQWSSYRGMFTRETVKHLC